jgi:hypothetical protein
MSLPGQVRQGGQSSASGALSPRLELNNLGFSRNAAPA